MKDLKKFLVENRYSRTKPVDCSRMSKRDMENWVIASYPIGKIKMCIDDQYGCDIDVTIEEDEICFDCTDPYDIHFTIERFGDNCIVCREGIKDCLQEYLKFPDSDFHVM